MTDSFTKLREILRIDDIPEDSRDFEEGCYRRLLNALHHKSKSGEGDIASLIRHILRFEDEKQGGKSQTLLQVTRSLLSREICERCGITILREDKDNYLISAHPWKPEWLTLGNKYPPDTPLFKGENRRNYEPVPGDPFLQIMQLDKYRSIGQREAIRAVLTAPEKSTLVINLPTGSGKSLCAQLPALLSSQNGGVSIVVVPTIALAIDQERVLEQFITHPTAYYSDDSVEGQERRQGIRDSHPCRNAKNNFYLS